jgi:hypothetical protein
MRGIPIADADAAEEQRVRMNANAKSGMSRSRPLRSVFAATFGSRQASPSDAMSKAKPASQAAAVEFGDGLPGLAAAEGGSWRVLRYRPTVQ